MVAWLVLIGVLAIGAYCVDSAANIAKKGLQDNLTGLAKSFAVAVKDAGHEKILLEPLEAIEPLKLHEAFIPTETREIVQLYWRIIKMMEEWQKQIPVAASIYTFRKNADGNIVFICCPDADLDRNGKIEGDKEERQHVGRVYTYESEEDIIEFLDAFEGKSSYNYFPIPDDWGLWITAAEPIVDDETGTINTIVCVDFWGELWNEHIQRAVFWPYLFLLSTIILFFVVQISMIRRRIVEDRLTKYAFDLETAMSDLVTAKKGADAAIQAKNHFLANMSHEIRTPLNAILGCVKLFASANEGTPIRCSGEQLVDIMRKSSNDLMKTIDDVLAISDMDMDRMTLISIPVDIRQLVEDVKEMMSPLLADKPNLKFRVEWEESVPKVILGDPTRLRQILQALVGNAIKFTDAGHIVIRCSLVRPADEIEGEGNVFSEQKNSWIVPALDSNIAQAKGLRGVKHMIEDVKQRSIISSTSILLSPQKLLAKSTVLWIDVSDTGIGIERDQFDKLFDPFSQVDDSSTRQFGGSGLGLSVVKGLIQRMGGTVHVESIVGYGSTFSILLPINEQECAAKTAGNSPPVAVCQKAGPTTQNNPLPLQNYKILVVDDVVVNRLVVETKLVDMGAKVQGATNGQTAVDMVLEAEKSTLPFDFVLMDLQMPIMDGFEATHTLRQRGFKKPIVALTANYDSKEEAINSGCNQVLQKPADWHTLLDTITALVRGV